jgi:hypothetical protein
MSESEQPKSDYIPQRGLRSFLKWLVLTTFALVVGCGVAQMSVLLFQPAGSEDYDPHALSSMASSSIVAALVAGSIVALLFYWDWKPPIPTTNRHWFVLNVLSMIIGIFLTLVALDLVGSQSYPLIVWVVISALVGGILGGAHWLFLRQRVRHAGWWIPAMASSWTIVWLLTYFVAWIIEAD